MVARVGRADDDRQVVIRLAPRATVTGRADHEAIAVDPRTTDLVVAEEHFDTVVSVGRLAGLDDATAPRAAIEDLVGLAAELLRPDVGDRPHIHRPLPPAAPPGSASGA
ncbi:MAG: hypothetical protein ACKOVH_01460 [Actinomycetota bacterium]